MSKLGYTAAALVLVLLLSTAIGTFGALAAHPTVNLLTASNFAVLAGSAVNDSNPSTVIGDVGLSPASGSFIDVTCAEVTGTIYAVDAAGPAPCAVSDAGLLTTAKNSLTTAYNDAAGRPATTIATELGGVTLLDGTYDSNSTTFEILASGTLTLDGEANPDAVFILKMGTTLVTGSNSQVVLVNGAQACNVFWQVGSSAVLGTGTNFVGTIMADQSITDNGGSTVDGRFLARVAAVTLNNTTITRPLCAGDKPTSTSTGTMTATSTATSSATATASVTSSSTSTNTPGGPVEDTATSTSTNTPGGSQTDTATPTNTEGPQNTEIPPQATLAATSQATVTLTAPAVVGMPATGGAPLRPDNSIWVLLVVISAVGAGGVLLARRRMR